MRRKFTKEEWFMFLGYHGIVLVMIIWGVINPAIIPLSAFTLAMIAYLDVKDIQFKQLRKKNDELAKAKND